jgi:hypothetical protein
MPALIRRSLLKLAGLGTAAAPPRSARGAASARHGAAQPVSRSRRRMAARAHTMGRSAASAPIVQSHDLPPKLELLASSAG